MKRFAGIQVALMSLLIGCSVTQPAVKVDYYQLEYQPPPVKDGQALNVVVGVRRFGIASAYDHDRLVGTEKNLRVTQSYYHRWVNNPRMMLSDLLLRDLAFSGNYKAVMMLPSEVLPDFEINCFVQEIVQDDSGAQPKVVVAMDVTLLGNPTQKDKTRVIFQKSYSIDIPCPEKTPAGIVKAMSVATKNLSAKIQQDVYEGIKTASVLSPL